MSSRTRSYRPLTRGASDRFGLRAGGGNQLRDFDAGVGQRSLINLMPNFDELAACLVRLLIVHRQDRVDEAEQALAEAESSLAQLSSASHRAVAWSAQGDLALHRGDDRAAGALFRRAAEALQELKF